MAIGNRVGIRICMYSIVIVERECIFRAKAFGGHMLVVLRPTSCDQAYLYIPLGVRNIYIVVSHFVGI